MKTRFDDASLLIDDFADHFLVQCPHCQQVAHVRWLRPESAARASCAACGFSKDWRSVQPGVRVYTGNASRFTAGVAGIGASSDWCFHYPLWLTTHCCGQELWAYNPEHLAWLKGYVAADLRQHAAHPVSGRRNKTLASRLPKWLKAAKNRDEILRAVVRLEKLLPAA